MRVTNGVLLPIILSGLTACAGKQTVTVPVEERSIPHSNVTKPVTPEQGAYGGINEVESSGLSMQQTIDRAGRNPAVVALLSESQSRLDERMYDSANAVLERAIRLEPKNAILWHRLAVIHFKQGDWQQTIPLAQKSTSLAANDAELQAANWRIIAKARMMLGNKTGSKQAEKEAIKPRMNQE